VAKLATPNGIILAISAENEKFCERKQPDGVFVENKHDLEKLCERKKQHCSSMMPLLSTTVVSMIR